MSGLVSYVLLSLRYNCVHDILEVLVLVPFATSKVKLNTLYKYFVHVAKQVSQRLSSLKSIKKCWESLKIGWEHSPVSSLPTKSKSLELVHTN